MWYLIKGSIIFAVVASNIHWHWTPNAYLAGLAGVVLAYGVTVLGQYVVGPPKRARGK